ncbi:transposase [Candidatus Tisiphia endosymbiont of Beris chalybata]|uniref:transposase n=1 Tax=Candidatus Tisiphia endosymbiont of Beris chalybata TaxID=3066262 RepID=UPI00312C996B
MQEVYLIINNKGEIMAVKITKGNRSDISTVLSMTQGLEGKLFGDKAYISKEIFNKLFAKSLRLFTSIRKDMTKHLLGIEDKVPLKNRALIESVFNVLKNCMNLEHSRNRSPVNFLIHILACVVGYAIKKLSLKLVTSANPPLFLS